MKSKNMNNKNKHTIICLPEFNNQVVYVSVEGSQGPSFFQLLIPSPTSFDSLVTLGDSSPRRLGVALELPSVWWAKGKFVKVGFASEREGAILVKPRLDLGDC